MGFPYIVGPILLEMLEKLVLKIEFGKAEGAMEILSFKCYVLPLKVGR